MNKILIVEGLCACYTSVTKPLEAEGYRVRAIRDLAAVDSSLREYPADLVLIGLGIRHDQAWQLLRHLKADYPQLPVLIYQVVNGKGLEDLIKTVEVALAEAARKKKRRRQSHGWFSPLQPAF